MRSGGVVLSRSILSAVIAGPVHIKLGPFGSYILRRFLQSMAIQHDRQQEIYGVGNRAYTEVELWHSSVEGIKVELP